jgi:hypothetical protein
MPSLRGALQGACLSAAAVVALLSADARAQPPWQYTLGEHKSSQQGSFCLQRQTVLELSRVFRHEVPRPGFAALERASDCNTRIESFTPLEVVSRVRIATSDGEYTVSFVEIRTAAGATQYLVTTRGISE